MEDELQGDDMYSYLNHVMFSVGNNDLILKKVFSFLNLEEIKKCRLVNKKWLDVSQSIFNGQSVIKIQYGKKNPKNSQLFMSEHENAPLFNTFDSVAIHFRGLFRFEWQVGSATMNFLEKYGHQLKYLKLRVVKAKSIQFNFIAIKRVLAELLPELEHLCVEVEIAYEAKSSAVDCSILNSGEKLLKLRKLEWLIIPQVWLDEDEFKPDESHRKIFTSVLRDLLNSCPILQNIATGGSLLTSDAFDDVNEKIISQIKEMSIVPKISGHDFHPFLDKMLVLARKGLRLSSFHIIFLGSQDDYAQDDCAFVCIRGVEMGSLYYTSLINFLNSQKDNLQTLRLNVCMSDPELSLKEKLNMLPKFLPMSKLEQLEVNARNDRYVPHVLFRGYYDNWNHLFPNLKALDVIYDFDPKDVYNLPRFVRIDELGLKSKYPTVQVMRLLPQVDDIVEMVSLEVIVPSFFERMKVRFPNLKKFQMH